MFASLARVALVGLSGAYASAEAACEGNATCQAQPEDGSLMQLRGAPDEPLSDWIDILIGSEQANSSRTATRKSFFAQNTVPYLGQGTGVAGAGAQMDALLINEDGFFKKYYLPGATIVDDGQTVEFSPGNRFYLMKEPTTDYSKKQNFHMPFFPGKTFEVDVEYRRDGPSCGCNLNFYLVSMPWHTPGKDSDYYCDAQCFEGMGCCAEFDLSEGNMAVQQVTNHACTANYGMNPEWQCNKQGDPGFKTHPKSFGPGPRHTIDSTKVFTHSTRFDVVGGNRLKLTTTLSQDGKTAVLRMGPKDVQLNSMLEEMQQGMALVAGYWYAKDMHWLDGDSCGYGEEHCNKHPAYLSNWRITTNDPNCGGAWQAACRRRAATPRRREDNHHHRMHRRRVTTPAPTPEPTPEPTPLPTPRPTPAPTPEPTESLTNGQCCYGNAFTGRCTSCKNDRNDWCTQHRDNCWKCDGQWCAN